MRAIFFGKDGTLVETAPYNADASLLELTWRAGRALQWLQQSDYKLFIVADQAGLAEGLYTETMLEVVRQRLSDLLAQYGVLLSGFYYCPHSISGVVARYAVPCSCRMPMPGLLQRAAAEHAIDLSCSWMVSNSLKDIEAGHRAGCRTIFIDNGSEAERALPAPHTPSLVATDLYVAATSITALS